MMWFFGQFDPFENQQVLFSIIFSMNLCNTYLKSNKCFIFTDMFTEKAGINKITIIYIKWWIIHFKSSYQKSLNM